MNRIPQHLLSEDRQEYERLLDEALRSAPHRPELAALGQRLNGEQLRTMAMNATALITSAAATEYQHYVKVRDELRNPPPLHDSSRGAAHSGSASAAVPSAIDLSVFRRSDSHPVTTDHPGRTGLGRRFGAAVLGIGHPGGRRFSSGVAPQRWARMSYARRLLATVLGLHVRPEVPAAPAVVRMTAHKPPTRRETPDRVMAQAAEEAGAGTFAVLAVLTPLLSGVAAAIFLLVGLGLKAFSVDAALARTMMSAGWLFGAVTLAAVVTSAIVLLVVALRRGRTTPEADRQSELSEAVTRAREAWRDALLERGIIPFLREALADPGGTTLFGTSSAPPSRMPSLGYNRPGFLSPDDDGVHRRPSFTSPDYTSPDFGGPEHQSE